MFDVSVGVSLQLFKRPGARVDKSEV
jgi:hypothetical protein